MTKDKIGYDSISGMLDITGADDVQVTIRADGKVLWVNSPGVRLRICRIRGQVLVVDNRETKRKEGDRANQA